MQSDELLRRLHEKELEIFKEFKNICTKYNLKYYLSGGTLLGAVRHKGFIPWDDDIDVSMPYSDYKIFLEVAPKELNEMFFLQTAESESGFCAPFAKIRLNNTTFLDSQFAKRHINHGIWIDILPLIYTKNTAVKRKKQIIRFCKAIQMDDLIASNQTAIESEYGRKTIKYLKILHKCLPFRIRKIIGIRLIKAVCSSKPADYCFEVGGIGHLFPSRIFGEPVSVQFEDDFCSAPSNFDEYLTIVFGDYMQLPPEDQRTGLHADIIDFYHSYPN